METFTQLYNGPYSWLLYVTVMAVGGAIMFVWAAGMAVIWTYGERRIAAFIQSRLGPNRVGPWGILQPIADGIKLLAKEDVRTKVAAKLLYNMAPLLVFIGAFMPFAALPFSERWVVVNMDIGLYYILAFEAVEVIGILMAGFAPGSKWSLYGGMRLAAQMLSYEVPLGLCVMVVIILAGSLNLASIVEWQSHNAWGFKEPWILGWTIFRSPAAFLAFIMFYIGGLASTKRAPFDLPEAESELVAGYHTEYSGMRFAFFFMAEYASMYLICGLAAVIFLGGWYGPIPQPAVPEGVSLVRRWSEFVAAAGGFGSLGGWVWGSLNAWADPLNLRILAHEAIGAFNMVLKAFSLYFIMIWARWTLPRIRIDQVMHLCLKVLLPFSLLCVILALVQVAVF